MKNSFYTHKSTKYLYSRSTNSIFSSFSFFLWGLIAFSLVIGFGIFSVQADNTQGTEKTFVVSAYYSPLPNQNAYVRGNYEAEKRLQGNGIRGANNTKVYVGMLAAPKTYAFGTKIQIPGLGVGTVHDRGGAIRAYNGFDRIDVWMGYGDDGRKRALQWGMRKVQGKIVSKNTPENLNFTVISRAKASEVYTFKRGNTSAVLSVGTTSSALHTGDKGDRVKKLQNFLKKEGFFSGVSTGYFGPRTEKSVFEFQKFHGIVSSSRDAGAGTYGPLTQAKVKELWNRNPEEKKYMVDVKILPVGLGLGDKNAEVKRLQMMLKNLGYFDVEPNGVFGPKTQKSVLAFQKKTQIITLDTDRGAGYFGPQTHKALFTALLKKRMNISSKMNFKTKDISQEYLSSLYEKEKTKQYAQLSSEKVQLSSL